MPPLDPGDRDALLGLLRERRHREAIEQARALIKAHPGSVLLQLVVGSAARGLGRLQEAQSAFLCALDLDPGNTDARFNLALVLQDRGCEAEAIAAYRAVIGRDPDHFRALNNLANALSREGEHDAAIGHLEHAIVLRPGVALLHQSFANALRRAGRFGAAVKAYQEALAIDPDIPGALYNIALIEQERGDPERALESYREILARDPSDVLARQQLVSLLAQQCDWDALEPQGEAIASLGVSTDGVPPFALLAQEDDPARQLIRARKWAARALPVIDAPSPARPRIRPERLRIGIFSSDFHDHPMMHLMAGLLSAIDRERFELHAFSYGEQREDDYRRKARERVDHFHDVGGWSDARIIEHARAADLAIALDRKGYTAGSRSELLAHRLAPVQINYLAYPGTMGAPFIDYLVADPVTVPDSQRAHISEKLIRLPHCYAPSDDQREIAPLASSRADCGLPEAAFVLASFNAPYKITPREFDIWMRLLREIDDAVLWQYSSNPFAERNLRLQAERRGIDPARLVFAPRLPSPDHLARHTHADLAIDSFAVGAHTTANDALWAGLPLVTRIGDQFAARVAASILAATGMNDLVTSTDAAYEALILELAQDRERLAVLKAKLARNRIEQPMYNTALYARHFERGLEAAWERWFAGLEPADIDVAALG